MHGDRNTEGTGTEDEDEDGPEDEDGTEDEHGTQTAHTQDRESLPCCPAAAGVSWKYQQTHTHTRHQIVLTC